jgi:hypothetical protein
VANDKDQTAEAVRALVAPIWDYANLDRPDPVYARTQAEYDAIKDTRRTPKP